MAPYIGNLLVILCFVQNQLNVINANFINSCDINHRHDIFEMMISFSDHFRISHWVLHCMFEDCQYFGARLAELNNKKATEMIIYHTFRFDSHKNDIHSIRSSSVTLQVFLNQDITQLNEMLQDEGSLKADLLQKIGNTDIPPQTYWLIHLCDNKNITDIKNAFKLSPLRYDTRSFVFLVKDDGFQIYDIYKTNVESDVIVKEFGNWDPQHSLKVVNPSIWERRSSLEGYHLRSAVALNDPLITKIEHNCSCEDCFNGAYASIWHALKYKMNFTYTIWKETVYGSLENDSWNGMIGMLAKRDIDIAPADFTITMERSKVVDYLPGLTSSYQMLFIKNPAETMNWKAYIEPFAQETWIAILAFIFFVPIVIFGMISYGYDEYGDFFNLGDSYCFLLKSMIMLGNKVMPGSFSNRISFITVMLASILIYYHWEAMVISYLAVRTTQLPIITLQDLVKNSNLKLLLQKGTSYVDMFRYASDPMLVQIYRTRIEPYLENYPTDKKELTEILVNDPSYVVYDNAQATRAMQPFVKCEVIDTGVQYYPVTFAYAMPKHSQFFEAFEYHINHLKEIGAVKRYHDMYKTQEPVCPDYSGMPINEGQCFTAFIVLVLGATISFAWFGIEWFLPRRMFLKVMDFANKISDQSMLSFLRRDKNEQTRNTNIEKARTHSVHYSKDELAHLSKQKLIEKIKQYEKEASELRKEINDKEIVLQHSKEIADQKLILERQIEIYQEKICSRERAILGIKFDKAFN